MQVPNERFYVHHGLRVVPTADGRFEVFEHDARVHTADSLGAAFGWIDEFGPPPSPYEED